MVSILNPLCMEEPWRGLGQIRDFSCEDKKLLNGQTINIVRIQLLLSGNR